MSGEKFEVAAYPYALIKSPVEETQSVWNNVQVVPGPGH